MHTRDFGGKVVHGNIFADYYDLFAVDRYGENIVIRDRRKYMICDLSILGATTSVQVFIIGFYNE